MIPAGTPVDVYWNLHRKCFSVRARTGPQAGKVIAHTDTVTITDAQFVVSKAGRLRVLREQRKNVHATIRGLWAPPTDPIGEPVTYDPYKYEAFVIGPDKAPVTHADLVTGTTADRRAVLHAVAARAGFEPATSALTVRRSAN